jgi:hypothetical protein
VQSDEDVLDWVAKDAETALHPSCTCRLGTGDGTDSVLDPASMRVHGVDGIRVVDASALRYVTNGNIYAPTMMLAEKSADLIRGSTPLAAISEPFYRHQVRGSAASATAPSATETVSAAAASTAAVAAAAAASASSAAASSGRASSGRSSSGRTSSAAAPSEAPAPAGPVSAP